LAVRITGAYFGFVGEQPAVSVGGLVNTIPLPCARSAAIAFASAVWIPLITGVGFVHVVAGRTSV
jgi:hypothetical protein